MTFSEGRGGLGGVGEGGASLFSSQIVINFA